MTGTNLTRLGFVGLVLAKNFFLFFEISVLIVNTYWVFLVGQALVQVFSVWKAFYSSQRPYELGIIIITTLLLRKNWGTKKLSILVKVKQLKNVKSGFSPRLTPESVPLTKCYNYRTLRIQSEYVQRSQMTKKASKRVLPNRCILEVGVQNSMFYSPTCPFQDTYLPKFRNLGIILFSVSLITYL